VEGPPIDDEITVEDKYIKIFIVPFDPRLEQLRTLLLGREIELSRQFSELLDDSEQLAIAGDLRRRQLGLRRCRGGVDPDLLSALGTNRTGRNGGIT
jgi:hypothetical protein